VTKKQWLAELQCYREECGSTADDEADITIFEWLYDLMHWMHEQLISELFAVKEK
jgi:hypothetical protein